MPPVAPVDKPLWWGGYRAEFKPISKEKHAALGDDIDAIRRDAQVIDTRQGRRFRIDISSYEFCEGKTEAEVEGFTVYVYTPAMCAIEKLRAVCQQMPEYHLVSHPTARARDFYDIYAVLTRTGLDLSLPENLELFRHIFAAKEVPLSHLGRIAEVREFHRPDWDAVRSSVVGETFEFDFYFDYVLADVAKLNSLWEE